MEEAVITPTPTQGGKKDPCVGKTLAWAGRRYEVRDKSQDEACRLSPILDHLTHPANVH